MLKLLQKFRRTEDGAVTVDWIVLTAGIIGASVFAANEIFTASSTLTGATSDSMQAIETD